MGRRFASSKAEPSRYGASVISHEEESLETLLSDLDMLGKAALRRPLGEFVKTHVV